MNIETKLIVLKFLEQYEPDIMSAEIFVGRMVRVVGNDGYDREICLAALKRKSLGLSNELNIELMDSQLVIQQKNRTRESSSAPKLVCNELLTAMLTLAITAIEILRTPEWGEGKHTQKEALINNLSTGKVPLINI
jgi:hypothetical protein